METTIVNGLYRVGVCPHPLTRAVNLHSRRGNFVWRPTKRTPDMLKGK